MSQVDDVVAASPDAEFLLAPRPVPWGGLLARLRASPGLRRLVPAQLAMAVLDLSQRLAVARNPRRLNEHRAAMDAIVGGTGWEGDLDRLAFRHLCAWARGWELTGRPWLLKNMRVQGVEALHDVEPGRGVVFSAPHFGPLVGMAALPQHVGPVHVAVGEHQVADLPAGYDGYQIEQVRRYMRECDLVPVRAIGSARTFTEVLKGGGRVLLNLDVPGRTPVLSLGEMVELMNGTVRLAQSTDSVVVPVIPLARGRRWYLHVAAPIDSRNYPAREDLLQAIVTSIEELILRAPEYLENPLRDGGWAVATRDGWRRSA